MSRILLVGAGRVAYRAAQQLAGTVGVEELLVADRDGKRAKALAARIGGPARACMGSPEESLDSGIDAVAVAVPARSAVGLATTAVAAGIPSATVTDEEDGIAALLALDGRARAADVALVIGCGVAPGIADVLAGHAASLFDEVDEVHLARVGSAGPGSVDAVRTARRARPVEIIGGIRSETKRSGDALVWFPDPIGARECTTVATGVRLTTQAIPKLLRATVRFGEPEVEVNGVTSRMWRPGRRTEPRWGGARAEVWGWRGGRRDVVIYGLVEHADIATGTTLAVTAAALAGVASVSTVLRGQVVGAHGLGAVAAPGAFLSELARRGVRAATFEGRQPGSAAVGAPGNIDSSSGT